MEEQAPDELNIINSDVADHSDNDTVNVMATKAFKSVGPAIGTLALMIVHSWMTLLTTGFSRPFIVI